MSEELKPCPFCGSSHVKFCVTFSPDGGEWLKVVCLMCGSSSLSLHVDSHGGNIGVERMIKESWNKRCPEKS